MTSCFSCKQPATSMFYTLSLHDALPISTPDSVDTEQVGGPADDFLVAHLQLDAGVMVLAGRSDAEPSFSLEKPCKSVLIAWTVPSHELGGKGSLRRFDRRLAWGHLRAGQRAIDLRPPCRAEFWPHEHASN